MASNNLTRCPNAKLLEVLVRQARENRLVYVILAEDHLVLGELQAPQRDHNVHDDGAHTQTCRLSSSAAERVSRTSAGTALLYWTPLPRPASRVCTAEPVGATASKASFYNVVLGAPMRGVAAIVLYLISVIVIAVLVVSFLNYGRYGF
jgi:hypothetical protein